MDAFVTIFGPKWTVFPARRAGHFQNRKGENVPHIVIRPRPSQPLYVRIVLYLIFAATSFYFCNNFVLFSLQQLFLTSCIKQFKIAATFKIVADVA